MASDSYSSNALVVTKPNRFYRARFRNIRWNRTNTVDTTSVNANYDTPIDEATQPAPPVLTPHTNESIQRIRDKYNQ